MNYGWDNQGMNGGWWVLMVVGMVAFWAIFVFGIVALLRYYGPRKGVTPPVTNRALEILKERLARGELTEEEYTQRRKLLEGES